jgi:hypothetical protein
VTLISHLFSIPPTKCIVLVDLYNFRRVADEVLRFARYFRSTGCRRYDGRPML